MSTDTNKRPRASGVVEHLESLCQAIEAGDTDQARARAELARVHLERVTRPIGPADYKDAVDFVQGACNLSGVLLAFATLIPRLVEANRGTGNTSQHLYSDPILILWMDKLYDLMGRPGITAVFNAMEDAEKAALEPAQVTIVT
jgi:hypothetical protein